MELLQCSISLSNLSDSIFTIQEVNDEIPENTAFLAQADPDTGMDQGGVVETHPGFGNGPGFMGPVAIPMYGVVLNANFQDASRYPNGVVRIQVIFDNGGKKSSKSSKSSKRERGLRQQPKGSLKGGRRK